MNLDFRCPLTPSQLSTVKQQRIEAIFEWVGAKYKNIRLPILEQNLEKFEEVYKYDQQCKVCMSTQQCPTLDGCRPQCEIMPDGFVRLWYVKCPKGHTLPKQAGEYRAKKNWREDA